MNQFWNFIQSIPIQMWFVIGVFVFSMIGQVGKSLNTMKQKRRLELEKQRRMDEAMRTGRPVPDPVAEQASEIEARRQRLAEMQQRRQAQLEELRRRRQEMLQRQGGQPTGQPTGQQGGQLGGRQVQAPQQAQSRVSPAGGAAGLSTRPTAQPMPTRTPTARPGARPTNRPRPVSPTGHAGSHTVSEASSFSTTVGGQPGTHGTIHVSEDLGTLGGHTFDAAPQQGAVTKPFQHALLGVQPAGATGLARHGIQLKGRDDLRRAIILAEILERPVALRPDRLETFE